jgi:hypothetical protein
MSEHETSTNDEEEIDSSSSSSDDHEVMDHEVMEQEQEEVKKFEDIVIEQSEKADEAEKDDDVDGGNVLRGIDILNQTEKIVKKERRKRIAIMGCFACGASVGACCACLCLPCICLGGILKCAFNIICCPCMCCLEVCGCKD